MSTTKYPIILVHGIVLRDVFSLFKAFAGIENNLRKAGYTVYTSDTDGFGTVENNAAQLKEQILRIRENTGCEKVNLVAHSKGGLDSKYMIQNLGMEDYVASLTTISTPHKGSRMASSLYRMPPWLARFFAFWIDFAYSLFGDKAADSYAVCRQLQEGPNQVLDNLRISDKVYCRSYSAKLQNLKDDFVMGIPYVIMRYSDGVASDGLVSVESAQFGEYKGECLDGSVSHTEIVGFCANTNKRERVYAFYRKLAEDLAELGF